MIFGAVPVAEATGAILAHSVAVVGGRLRKGQVLGADDVAALIAAGHAQVVVARPGPDDVGEDAAAAALAAALVPDAAAAGLRIGAAATGRVNLFAEAPGIVAVAADRIDAVNAVDAAITVATVPRWQRLAAGGMAATIKIIPYAVPRAALAAACAAAAGTAPALRLHRAALARVALIQTMVGPLDAPAASRAADKGRQVTGERVTRLGAALDAPDPVPHDVGPLAEALAAVRADAVLILTGSATSDLADVAPEAVRRAGGRVAHFGMPVDPGNLLFLGALADGRPVIGLPGCARAPALNGADWVLERVICGVPVRPADIAGMGVGGLLKEIPQRGRPREA